jgi:hypothetical protein
VVGGSKEGFTNEHRERVEEVLRGNEGKEGSLALRETQPASPIEQALLSMTPQGGGWDKLASVGIATRLAQAGSCAARRASATEVARQQHAQSQDQCWLGWCTVVVSGAPAPSPYDCAQQLDVSGML